MKLRSVLLLLVVVGLMAGGCAEGGRVVPPPATPTEDMNVPVSSDMTPEPTTEPMPIEGDVIVQLASVDEIAIMILESFPVQVRVVARGSLSDACTQTGEITTERQDNRFDVTITSVRPEDRMCAQVPKPFEESIALDVESLEAGDYTVNVNGVTDAFTLDVDNVPQSE